MEVELKLRLHEDMLADLQCRLQEMATSTSEGEQVDTYFSHPCRDFALTDEALRLRQAGNRLEVTYKGPRAPGDFKVRPETNIHIEGDAIELLESLGFGAVAKLTKHRQTWAFLDVEVAIDHVAGLGWFVELEALHGHAEAEQAIDEARERLGLADCEPVSQSYLGMALAAGADGVQRP